MSDLFSAKSNHLDQEYLVLKEDIKYANLRQHLQETWNKFEEFADRNFREEFAQQPRSRLWEMYLGVYLLDNNFNLRPHVQDGPDLSFVINDQIVWIEATLPNEGIGSDAIPSPFIPDPNRFGEIPEEKIILRYANSMSEKLKQRNNHLKLGIISPEDAFIVAINGMNIGFEILNSDPIPAITKTLFPIKGLQHTIDVENMEIAKSELTPRHKVFKISKAEVQTGIFLLPEYSAISGVLYSNRNLWDFPESDYYDEFLYIHNNLVAENNIEKSWLKHGKYCWLENNDIYHEVII